MDKQINEDPVQRTGDGMDPLLLRTNHEMETQYRDPIMEWIHCYLVLTIKWRLGTDTADGMDPSLLRTNHEMETRYRGPLMEWIHCYIGPTMK